MRKELLDIVCCPVHKTPLSLKAEQLDDLGDVVRGTLRCTACRFDYPIEEGIPNLLPPEYHVPEVKEKQAPAARKGKAK